jgi:hypothetical protein
MSSTNFKQVSIDDQSSPLNHCKHPLSTQQHQEAFFTAADTLTALKRHLAAVLIGNVIKLRNF